MINQQLGYDPTSAESIWRYSAGILGHTLREFVSREYDSKTGKGGLGQMVEEIYFHIANNSRAEADFAKAGIELKCTPLKKGSKDEFQIKERLVCNMINYCEVVNEPFEESHFYTKCQLMLLLFYLHVNDANKLDLEFLISLLWRFPAKDIAIIRHDYETIISKIKAGKAHELSEGDTLYLGACRKGQKGDALREQPFNADIKAPRRAFSLKPAYMRIILDMVLKSGKNHLNMVQPELSELVSSRALKTKSFEQIVLDRFTPFYGKKYKVIANKFNINLSNQPKNTFAMLAHAIASKGKSSNVNHTEEFMKAGLLLKTIRVQANGRINESMAFENIDYNEVHECEDWFESRLYEIFSSRFLFVVFREQTEGQGDYVLDKTFFWTMSQDDLNTAEKYWTNIRDCVENNTISPEYFWKISDHRCFHVRPKARVANDTIEAPLGGQVHKYCYWFNNEYITNIVNNN
ncbi:MAG: hypothetical protein MJZ84_04600 [Paludibacteraceae bacterium]|nr:hypothetical protein [Paludibacteraceae bacterium]